MNHINLLLIVSLLTNCSNFYPNVMLTPEEQQQDFDLMVDILELNCPVLSRYRSTDEIKNHFSEMRKQLTKTSSVLDFYLNIQHTLSFFDDGHLQSYASNDFYAAINKLEGFVPLQLKFLNGKIYIFKNLSNSKILQEGVEITSINDISAQKIFEELCEFISSDADNLYFKHHKLNNEYRLYLAYYFQFPNEYKLGFADTEEDVTLKAVSASVLRDLSRKKSPLVKNEELYSIKYNDETATAIFQFLTFGDREGEAELRAVLEDLLAQCKLKGITDLVLDIRGNTGGFDGNAAVIYSYLTDVPFHSLSGRYLKIKELSSLDYILNRDIQQTLKSVPLLDSNKEYKLNMALDQMFEPNKTNFTGRIYLLTDNSTFSTAALFTSMFHNNRRGLIVGTNTGGGYHGDSGGVMYVELPISKINVFVPLVRNEFTHSDTLNWRTFAPDIEVNRSIEDILHKNDRVMQKTFEIIEKKQASYPSE